MHFQKKLTRTQIIMIGFALIIFMGAVLLTLPFASRPGEHTTFLGALFTSVSATCVTGLVVYDTWSHWTLFGQIVLLCEIQIGGLGFITISTLFMMLLRRRIGLSQRALIQDSLSTLQIRGSVRLVRRIIIGTILFEGTGALILACRFAPELGLARGLFYGVFHAVSAFCNAGFDLMGFTGKFNSFCSYVGDPVINLVIMLLITIGGIGFVVWEDLLIHKWHWKQYAFQTKIVLTTSAVLVAGSAFLFWLIERNRLFAGMTGAEQFWASLFSAVTPRTAGFNTVDTGKLTDASKMLTMFLMLVGGSPGSTAGGMKTTTLTVVLLFVGSYLLRQRDSSIFHGRIGEEVVRKASIVMFINTSLALLGSFLIVARQGLPMVDVLFETCSAIGTVGMTAGITRSLGRGAQIIIMLLMYAGRMGSLTFAMSFTEKRRSKAVRYPEKQVIVG